MTYDPLELPLMELNRARLRSAREKANLNRAQLSAITGIPIETIVNIEMRQNSPSAERIARIARALDVPMESLFDDKAVA